MGLNLHDIVRKTINFVHTDETVQLYRSNGNTVDARGYANPTFRSPISVTANVQSVVNMGLGDSTGSIKNVHDNPQTQIAYAFYLYSDSALPDKVQGIDRVNARGGDMIKRYDGTWFLVTSVKEDFARVGWQMVIGTQQIKGLDDSQITEG